MFSNSVIFVVLFNKWLNSDKIYKEVKKKKVFLRYHYWSDPTKMYTTQYL